MSHSEELASKIELSASAEDIFTAVQHQARDGAAPHVSIAGSVANRTRSKHFRIRLLTATKKRSDVFIIRASGQSVILNLDF